MCPPKNTSLAFLLLALLAFSQVGISGEIHPSLLGPSRSVSPGDSVDVWIFFSDRGFVDQAAYEGALLCAERSLLPRARARRLKMHNPNLVDKHDLPVNSDYARQIYDLGARHRASSRYLNALSVRISRRTVDALAALPFVREIRPVARGRRIEPVRQPDGAARGVQQPPGVDLLDYGPSYDQLNQINVVAAHDSGYSGEGVLVCLLDTGFFTDHEALVSQPVIAEWDFINNDPETQNQPGDDPDQHNHGTYTFSTLGGAHEGDLYGPAYGASFIIGKTESVTYEQPIEEDWYVAGLEWADSLGAEVVSTSLGYLDWYTFADLDGNTCVTTIGVDIAVANGIVCVTAAGNEAESSWGHIIAPADADSVITVGAVNNLGVIASFSSPGPTYDGRIKPEVCARGVSTWCAAPWGDLPAQNYAGVSGTSLSTPLVGGSCALILEAHPDWTPMQVRMALLSTANNASDPNNNYGWGIINVMAAINFNFPPQIVQKHPEAGTVIAYPDSSQDFWVQAEDAEGDAIQYHWLLDDLEVYVGPDSQFIYQWTQPDTIEVMVIAEDVNGGKDSVFWTVQVQDLTGIGDSNMAGVTLQFGLRGNFPNPFNSSTIISFDLPQGGIVTMDLYSSASRHVATLLQSPLSAGRHQLAFDASGLPSGMYFCRLRAGDHQAMQKMVLIR